MLGVESVGEHPDREAVGLGPGAATVTFELEIVEMIGEVFLSGRHGLIPEILSCGGFGSLVPLLVKFLEKFRGLIDQRLELRLG